MSHRMRGELFREISLHVRLAEDKNMLQVFLPFLGKVYCI